MKAALLLAFFSALQICEPAQPAARLLALDGPLDSGVPPCVHRFAEESATIAATFLTEAGHSPQVVADVFLDGDELGAQLSKAVPFQPVANPTHPALLEGTFKLPLPDAEKPLLLRVRIRTAADAEPVVALAQFRLRVTPKPALRQALARMTDSARSGPELRLTVFGPLAGLRELLKEWKIPFDDEGTEMPVRLAAHSLAIGEAQDLPHLPQLDAKATLLLMHDDPAAAPGLTQKITPEGTVAQLNSSRHDDWRSSPFLHQQLTSTIEHHLARHD